MTVAQLTSSTLTLIPNEIRNIATLSAPTVHSNPSVAKPPAALPITRIAVLDTLREVARYKRNLIISGLVESENGDQEIACDLIAIHVKCPQPPPILSCLRLGKTTPNNLPRKLLIRFSTETEATHLLIYAKTLRISPDDYVAKNIFIDPDLTKEEDKHAYEKRLQRKQGTNREATLAGRNTGAAPASARS